MGLSITEYPLATPVTKRDMVVIEVEGVGVDVDGTVSTSSRLWF